MGGEAQVDSGPGWVPPISKPGVSCLSLSLHPEHFREQPQVILLWLDVCLFSTKDKLLLYTLLIWLFLFTELSEGSSRLEVARRGTLGIPSPALGGSRRRG